MTSGQGPQGSKQRSEYSFDWTAHVARLTPDEFKQRYRLDFDSFYKLLDAIRADISVTSEQQARFAKCGGLVLPETRLAMALRFLAGGDPLDLKLIYDVSKSFVYDSVWAVVDAINNRFSVEFPIDDEEKLRVLEAEFRARARCPGWIGQVGALDGVHFAMKAPTANDVDDPQRYHVARKAEYALLCMALCDAEMRFMFYDISQCPTTHDSMAWGLTDLGQRIEHGDLPAPFFINADAAFSVRNSLITPAGDAASTDFDYHQSSNRVVIERAFGVLVRRWAVLWKPLQVRFDRRAPLVGACIRLHNFCIDRRIREETHSVHGLAQVWPIPLNSPLTRHTTPRVLPLRGP